MNTAVQEIFGNKLRVRVCGLCIQDDTILLADHKNLGTPHFWAPPGGGVQVGETAIEALVREFKEETGFNIKVCDFLFTCEFIHLPLHAIELFFEVKIESGNLATGNDPEMGDQQIIHEVRFFSEPELGELPTAHLHGIFKQTHNLAQIGRLRGYFKL
ncbi:MAG: NUDIX hydrolase [Cyclobacteriaceae bacterium]|nr:NUDIX hydrolase [Cyclobacteriaceae bacterium]